MARKNIKTGIYLIENLLNGKKYVGQSKNIYARWSGHRCDSKEKNLPLYFAMRKYGLENFKFSILEECEISQLAEREDYWITFYNSYVPNGYNLNQAETHHTNLSVPSKIMTIMEEIENGTDKLIEIANKYGYSKTQINRINQGKAWKLEGKDYPLRGHEELQIEVIKEMLNKNFSISEIAETFSVTVPTIKGFLKKNQLKVEDIRPPLSSSKRINLIDIRTNEVFPFRKKKDAAKWLYENYSQEIQESSYLSNLTYHLKNGKPYKFWKVEYAEVEE